MWELTTLPTPRVSATYAELRLPILYMAQYSRATDARDKVYGLLGLLPTELATKIDRIDQNYTLSTRQVFLDFAKAIIEVTGELDVGRCDWLRRECCYRPNAEALRRKQGVAAFKVYL